MSIVKRIAACAVSAAAVISAVLPLSSAESELLSQMNKAKSDAASYEESGRLYYAEKSLAEYASLAEALAESGEVSRAEAETAAAHRDILRFSPEIYIEDTAPSAGVAAGSDGYFSENATAVKLTVPYGMAYVEDFYQTMPNTAKPLTVLVELDVSNEATMKRIAFGKDDERLIRDLSALSAIEGRVYLSFAPNVNSMRQTRTVVQSFVSSYRYVAALAKRYAPGVKLVYAVGDVTFPDQNTLSVFYPGDDVVDVLGVELCHTYNGTVKSSSTAAYDRRCEYYDPVYSVKYIQSEFERLTGRDGIPLMVTGCSFPWDGKAKIADYAYEMERFYRLLPLVCPETVAVLYSNESSAYGICNLRADKTAMETYENCLTLPWYNKKSAKPLTGTLTAGTTARIELYCGGKFNDTAEIWQNGVRVDSTAVHIAAGDMTVYMTDDENKARIDISLVPDGDGTLGVEYIQSKYDFNGNGSVDFGDGELVLAHIVKIDVGMDTSGFDINGDGKITVLDVSALATVMTPPAS